MGSGRIVVHSEQHTTIYSLQYSRTWYYKHESAFDVNRAAARGAVYLFGSDGPSNKRLLLTIRRTAVTAVTVMW